MKLLLHTCCAPCLIYPLEKLRKDGFTVSAIFYNPNIHPFSEYKNRKQAVMDLGSSLGLEVFYPEYHPQEYFNAVNLKEEAPGRCSICWSMRLKGAAKQAKEKGFDCFSTTLLVSPYQDQERIKKLGLEAAGQEGVIFHYEDFRPGFRKAHDQAKLKGIYCQKYCGCIYSEMERYRKSGKH
ncbi:MAG: epoxyqueuosine reductase QueH [Candidatus Omnitrophica bacterium]|nr:epoxyqueuosine reductase QueH [Candidatus Omnitrophota bacterium]